MNNYDHTSYSEETIVDAIRALQGGVNFSWGRLSELLHAIEKSGYWQRDAASFTQWVNGHSDLLGSKPGSLWRYIASGKYYKKFQQQYPDYCKSPLADLPDQISPENIELLYKLSRVAPKEVFTPLFEKVMNCTAKRAELRSAWLNFRPIMDGQTARGKGVTPPTLVDPNKAKTEELMEALISHRLSCSSDWTGIKDLIAYKVYHEVGRSDIGIFDVVVVTQGKQSRLLFHGIEITRKITLQKIHHIKVQMQKCDLMWLALPDLPLPDELNKLPDHLGVLVVNLNEFKVVRPARLERSAKDTGDLAKVILQREILT